MVGLSVVLENQKSGSNIISKKTMLINRNSSSSGSKACSSSCVLLSARTNSQLNYPVPAFLEQCYLCKQKLLPGKDIYMYKGDSAFCSVECRCRQIFMDEEETLKKENCSLAAMKPSASSASSPSSSSSASRHRKAARNRAGGFAY
ncbi:Zf-FLZ domain - like 7 [Theobroma cacao]|nr:Zf-FLZ domain - like 7 [Theobroma cacao]